LNYFKWRAKINIYEKVSETAAAATRARTVFFFFFSQIVISIFEPICV
jgi:hypothetical protein